MAVSSCAAAPDLWAASAGLLLSFSLLLGLFVAVDLVLDLVDLVAEVVQLVLGGVPCVVGLFLDIAPLLLGFAFGLFCFSLIWSSFTVRLLVAGSCPLPRGEAGYTRGAGGVPRRMPRERVDRRREVDPHR